MLPEHKSFRRVKAPMWHRPTSWYGAGLRVADLEQTLAGFRSYSDEPMALGHLLEVDVLLPDGDLATAVVEVAWAEPLPQGHPARFEVGLRVVHAPTGHLARLESVLAQS
jgi:hypothetical protein